MSTTEFEESPINRLYRAGPGALSDFELVSLLTGSLDSARDIVREGLPSIARTDWTTRRGLSKRSAARISASLELGRRLAAPSLDEREPITAAELIASRLMLRYGTLPQEHLGAIYLDSRQRLLTERVIFVGTINSALVSTRDVLKVALDVSAAALIAFHNHPSGDPSPSAEDLVFTRKLVEAGKVLSVDVVDHIVLGTGRYVSLARCGSM